MQTSQLRPLGWALLMRHKDANQPVTATWLGSAEAPQECKPVSCHKDANQSVTATWLRSAMRQKNANLRLPKKRGTQSNQRMSQHICLARKQTHLRLDRAQDANLHLTKKCGTGFQKAAQNPEQSNRMSRYLTYLRRGKALLMRQKDANLHLAKKCGTGFQKAAQNPEQSNQADVAENLLTGKNGHI